MNTPGQNSNAVAELAFGMMVYAAAGDSMASRAQS
jgi:phosphoglycerate dehydrogenase-like enzyme